MIRTRYRADTGDGTGDGTGDDTGDDTNDDSGDGLNRALTRRGSTVVRVLGMTTRSVTQGVAG